MHAFFRAPGMLVFGVHVYYLSSMPTAAAQHGGDVGPLWLRCPLQLRHASTPPSAAPGTLRGPRRGAPTGGGEADGPPGHSVRTSKEAQENGLQRPSKERRGSRAEGAGPGAGPGGRPLSPGEKTKVHGLAKDVVRIAVDTAAMHLLQTPIEFEPSFVTPGPAMTTTSGAAKETPRGGTTIDLAEHTRAIGEAAPLVVADTPTLSLLPNMQTPSTGGVGGLGRAFPTGGMDNTSPDTAKMPTPDASNIDT